ncbi:ABC-type transport auxiliary lipoprotein family protein [Pontibaca salina]|nr:ABC-type transport auxiliary lipoprotein family protein [Pontibaca salina]
MMMTRRFALLGAAASLSGCSALSTLNTAATPLNTYDLLPVTGTTPGRRSGRTLLVARPDAAAAIATDRVMIKPAPLSITYLPDARWPDELPDLMQSLLIRSIAGTGRLGYVGPGEGGPVPDLALLTRLDAFQAEVTGDALSVTIDVTLTVLRDRDQRVIASRVWRQSAPAADDSAAAIVAAFQTVLNGLLPDMADWVAAA